MCLLLTMVAACGKKEPVSDDTPSASPSQGGNDPVVDEDEITEIIFWMFDDGNGGSGSKVKMVEEAINEVTIREIGVKVEMVWISQGDYGSQVTLAIANREQVDVFSIHPRIGFINAYSTGMLYDITDLLDSHGSDIKALFGEELLSATKIDGRIYGLPNYRNINSNLYISYRKDILEDLGYLDKYKNMTTWAEYEEIMEAIKNQGATYANGNRLGLIFPEAYIADPENIYEGNEWDTIGDRLSLIHSDQSGNIGAFYDKPEVAEMYKKVAAWYDKGYIYPDSAFSMDGADVMIPQNVIAGQMLISNFQSGTRIIGPYELETIQFSSGYVSTTSCTTWAMGISSATSQPEAAMKFLNLLYNSSELMNLYIYGIEGETYVINENGEADYPAGTERSTCGYRVQDYALGNQFLCHPGPGTGGDFRELAVADFENAPKSVYLGISVNTGDYGSLIGALSAVTDEYAPQMRGGMYTDAMYAEFMQKLDSAGVDEYIALFANAAAEFLA